MILTGENEVFGGKPVAMPFRPPQIPYVTAWDRTWAFSTKHTINLWCIYYDTILWWDL